MNLMIWTIWFNVQIKINNFRQYFYFSFGIQEIKPRSRVRKYPTTICMRLISFFILISLCSINVFVQTRTGGVTPTNKIPQLPYFIIQKTTLIPSTFGSSTSLVSSGSPYSVTVSFDKQMLNVNQSNVVSIGYSSSNANGNIAYSMTNTLTSSSTSMEIQLSMLGTSSFVKLSLSIIRTSDSPLQGSNYIVLLEISSDGPGNPGIISMPDFTGYEIYPFVKFVNIALNDTLPGSPQSQGFTTKYEIRNTTGSGVMLNVWVERDDVGANFFTLSVTLVVILINPTAYKSTAQFSSLTHHIQQSTTTSGTPVTIQDYSSTYQTSLLIGTSGFIQITPYSSSIDYSLGSTAITFTTNSLTSQHSYLLMRLVDLECPQGTPYKFKNDSKCYPCTEGTQMFVSNVTFTEYHNAIVDERCKLISRGSTGYAFDKTGEISAICAYCKECYVQYYLDNGRCYECRAKVPNCEECTPTAGCTKCAPGFNLVDIDNDPLTNNSICQKTVSCGLNCMVCNANASSCITCAAGYKVVDPDLNPATQNSYCVKECSQINCMTCSLDGSSCNECNAGFKKVFDNVTGKALCQIICPSNCADCTSDGTSCSTCNAGYQKVVNNVTGKALCQIICPSNCADCTSDGTSCSTCNAGYQKLVNNVTGKDLCQIICPSNCADCTSDGSSCNTCNAGYQTVTDSVSMKALCSAIVICSSNCQQCTISSCTKCETGFTLTPSSADPSSSNLICQVDPPVTSIPCGANCQQCPSPTSCKTCKAGYILNGLQCTAITCGLHCTSCNANGSSCLTCEEGYGLVDIDQNESTENSVCEQKQLRQVPPGTTDDGQKNNTIIIVVVVVVVCVILVIVGCYLYKKCKRKDQEVSNSATVISQQKQSEQQLSTRPSSGDNQHTDPNSNEQIEMIEDVISDDAMSVESQSNYDQILENLGGVSHFRARNKNFAWIFF